MSPNPALLTWPCVAPAGGGGITYIPGTYSGTSGTSVTMSGVDIGTEGANRVVVIVVGSGGTLNRECTSMTINGVTATRDATGGSARAGAFIFRANVPTGTSVDVVTVWTSTGHTFTLFVYASPVALTVDDTGVALGDGVLTTLSTSVTTDAAGTVVAIARAAGARTVTGVSFTSDATGALTEVGNEAGTGADVTISGTFDSAPPAAYGRVVAVAYH